MLRREKRDVELTLPKKTETVIEVELTLTQKRWYRAVFERNRNFLMQGPSKKIPSLINVLMQLRKVCNHPFLVAGSREAVYEDHYAAEAAAAIALSAATAAAAATAATPATAADGSAVAIADSAAAATDSASTAASDSPTAVKEEVQSSDQIQQTDVATPIIAAPALTNGSAAEPSNAINDNVKTEDLGPVIPVPEAAVDPALKDPLVYCSGKIVFLHKLLIKLTREKSKSLIFSQFTTTLDVIQEYLTDYGYGYERIDGGVTGYNRSAAITRFNQPDSKASVFLLTTRAGGLGLNLQAANTVIIYDSDWNPQGDLQAIARCHRLGQQKEVKVYRLLTRQTAETSMFQVASKKLGLTNILLNGLHSKVSNKEERNIDEILRQGATELFGLDDEASKNISDNFMAADIDHILKERSKEVVFTDNGYEDAEDIFASKEEGAAPEGDKSKSQFSQVTFIANKSDAALQLDDKNFWEKALPKEHTRIGRIKTLFTCPDSLKVLRGMQAPATATAPAGTATTQSIRETKKARSDAWKRFMPIALEISELRQSGEKPFETEEVLELLQLVLISDVYPEEVDRLNGLCDSIERPKRRRGGGGAAQWDISKGKLGKRDSDSSDDDDSGEIDEETGKKKKKKRRNGSEEDDWTPEENEDGTPRETQAQIDSRPALGSEGYKVSPALLSFQCS
jgi:Helicase conserved C-terminal domain/SNF2-related domain